jgi:hypothetical protein
LGQISDLFQLLLQFDKANMDNTCAEPDNCISVVVYRFSSDAIFQLCPISSPDFDL